MKKVGRPTDYNEKIAKEICRRLSEGDSLNMICFADDMPCKATVYNWLSNSKNKEFVKMYRTARELQADTIVDECLDIADYTAVDTITKVSKSGETYESPDHEWINRSRLRVDTRLKLAALMHPRKYKEQKRVEHTGADGKELRPILNVTTTRD